MLLKSLRLENIRSYTSQNIEFNDGSTLLIGDIGSGKTTILLSIEFALFGLIKGDISGSSLLRHGKKEGAVELKFDMDGKNVKIIRKLKRGKDDAISQDSGQIVTDNSVFDGTPIELKSKILELFGYPEELLNKNTSLIYRYTVYTPQEEMKKILFESRDERLDTLRKIFNIDKYKRIRENALAYAKELRNTKKILEGKIQDLNVLQQNFEDKKNSRESINSTLEKERKENERIKKSHEEKTVEIKNFEEKISQLNILKKDLEIATINTKNRQSELDRNNKESGMVEYRINEYMTKLKDLGAIDAGEDTIRETLKDTEEKLSRINTAKEVINKRLEDKGRDLENMNIEDVASLGYKHQNITKRLEQKDAKEREFDENKVLLDKMNLDFNTININRTNSVKVINQLKDLSVCPLCLQNVDFSHKVKILDKENANVQMSERKIIEFDAKKKELEHKFIELKKDLEELRKNELELGEINIKLSNIIKQQESRQTLEKEIEELKQKKEKLDHMDINKLVEIISKNRKILSNIEVRKHIEESLKEKATQKKYLEERNKKLQDELKVLLEAQKTASEKIILYDTVEKTYAEKKKELDAINKEFKDSDIRIVSIRKDLEMTDKDINRLSEDIAGKLKLKEKIAYISELNYWFTEHFVNVTSTIEKAIMQKIHVEFNELFKKWFEMLIDDESIDVSVDEEFTPVIMQNNYETDVSNLSGGEKTSVALAYRLALNKVINDLINNIKTKDLIILDEPTDGFSSEQLDRMRDVLQELDMKQLIMVSHEPKMESHVQNIIRVSKNEHNSSVMM